MSTIKHQKVVLEIGLRAVSRNAKRENAGPLAMGQCFGLEAGRGDPSLRSGQALAPTADWP